MADNPLTQIVSASRKASKARRRTIASSIADAVSSGDLPHEWLLSLMRGEAVVHREFVQRTLPSGAVVEDLVERPVMVPLEVRIDIAKELLPYFAPKLSATSVRLDAEPASDENGLTVLAQRLTQLQRAATANGQPQPQPQPQPTNRSDE